MKLITLVKKHCRNYDRIAKELPGKNSHKVAHKICYIYNRMKTRRWAIDEEFILKYDQPRKKGARNK